jgi:hypothetical protein
MLSMLQTSSATSCNQLDNAQYCSAFFRTKPGMNDQQTWPGAQLIDAVSSYPSHTIGNMDSNPPTPRLYNLPDKLSLGNIYSEKVSGILPLS